MALARGRTARDTKLWPLHVRLHMEPWLNLSPAVITAKMLVLRQPESCFVSAEVQPFMYIEPPLSQERGRERAGMENEELFSVQLTYFQGSESSWQADNSTRMKQANWRGGQAKV